MGADIFLAIILWCFVCVFVKERQKGQRGREARENTNEGGQKSHRQKWMREFFALGAEGTVPCCGDGPWDFEYSLLKKKKIYSENSLLPIFDF